MFNASGRSIEERLDSLVFEIKDCHIRSYAPELTEIVLNEKFMKEFIHWDKETTKND